MHRRGPAGDGQRLAVQLLGSLTEALRTGGENVYGLMLSLNMLIEFGDGFDYTGADF